MFYLNEKKATLHAHASVGMKRGKKREGLQLGNAIIGAVSLIPEADIPRQGRYKPNCFSLQEHLRGI